MDKEFEQSAQKALEAKKAYLESRLSGGGEKKPGDGHTTRFPDYGDDEESAVSEVEDYDTNVGIENDLSKDLRATNSALERMKQGKYGICLKCEKEIESKRLEAYPAASICLKCEKK